jgi:hypothetical protein
MEYWVYGNDLSPHSSDTPRSRQGREFGSAFSDKRTDESGKSIQKIKDKRKSGKRLGRKVKDDQKLVKAHKVERKLCQKVENRQNTISKARNGHQFVKRKNEQNIRFGSFVRSCIINKPVLMSVKECHVL